MTTALLMYVDMGWSEPELKGMVYGYATWYGGTAQLLVGMIEVVKGNTFGATAFSSYGCFWLGWSFFWIESQEGTLAPATAFETGETLWFITFGVLTFGFWILTLRKNACLAVVFGLLTITFFILAGGVHSEAAKKVGGYFGFATALSAFYTAFAELFAHEWGYHVLPGLKPLWQVDRKITQKGIEDRVTYEQKTNTLLADFHNLEVDTQEDISIIRTVLTGRAEAAGKKVNVIANYHGFLIANSLVKDYTSMLEAVQREHYNSVRRYHTDVFGNGDEPWGATSAEHVFVQPSIEHRVAREGAN
eukprot:CAMPEP_0171103542 /NCGR_PEP_ID=MMETSP0766_2-20121228/58972_1 /TAXON_ID=439317 /ORGANISM="Gambierdiscus australes, Strain CAWD 149" /LENGTH=303 /DNA_ID=CAMNT_0011563973 /DNA_START=119 /DNA_END=1030 /DNA_ORIENTATION=+